MKPQAWQREESCGPASTLTTNYQTATPSLLLYTTSLHAASVCVLNTGPCNQQILHILPLRCLANIKGGKGWRGISVCLCLLLYKTARLSAPRHRRGAAAQIEFHEYHVATWQVGRWFRVFWGFRQHLVKSWSHRAPGSDMEKCAKVCQVFDDSVQSRNGKSTKMWLI